MDHETGTPPDLLALREALQNAPQRFGYYAALRRMQCAHDDKPRIGESVRPADDALRLGQRPALTFAPSTLAEFDSKNGGVPRLGVNFFGLFGPNGPLPLHLTEYACDRLHNAGDPSLARFADMFHHRLLSLFFRAWAVSEPAVDLDRLEHSAYVAQIGALIGIGRPALRNRDALPDLAKIHHASRLACQRRNREGLEAMVSKLFEVPASIEEFVGAWLPLPRTDLCRLGVTGRSGGLGVNVHAGTRVWSAQHRFRLRLGPMTFADYRDFLPGGKALERLVALVRNYLNDELEWDVTLVLKRDDVPAVRLGTQHRLGWTSWLGCRRRAGDVGDAADCHLNPRRNTTGTQRHDAAIASHAQQ